MKHLQVLWYFWSWPNTKCYLDSFTIHYLILEHRFKQLLLRALLMWYIPIRMYVLSKQYLISYLDESWVLKTLFIKKVLFLWSHIHHGIYPPKMISIYNERIPYIIQVGIYFFFVGPFSKWIAFLRDDNGPFISSIRTFVRSSPLPTTRILIIELWII